MPRLKGGALTRLHLRLYESDLAALRRLYGASHIKLTEAIRQIVHSYVRQVEAQTSLTLDNDDEKSVAAALDAAVDELLKGSTDACSYPGK